MKKIFHISVIMILSFAMSCSFEKAIEHEINENPVQCELLDMSAISDSTNPFVGNWRWLKTNVAFGGTRTPETEGYMECWIIAEDSITICRDGFIEFKFDNQIHYDEHPFAGAPGYPDSTYLFFNRSGIISLYGDTLEIYDLYVDGNDYWLVKK